MIDQYASSSSDLILTTADGQYTYRARVYFNNAAEHLVEGLADSATVRTTPRPLVEEIADPVAHQEVVDVNLAAEDSESRARLEAGEDPWLTIVISSDFGLPEPHGWSASYEALGHRFEAIGDDLNESGGPTEDPLPESNYRAAYPGYSWSTTSSNFQYTSWLWCPDGAWASQTAFTNSKEGEFKFDLSSGTDEYESYCVNSPGVCTGGGGNPYAGASRTTNTSYRVGNRDSSGTGGSVGGTGNMNCE